MEPADSQTATGQEARESKTTERAAFNTIAEAMEPLADDVRVRLIRALITFFDLPIGEPSIRSTGTISGNQVAPPSFSEDRSVSPKVFMLEKRPNTDVERITCLAYYLTHYRDLRHFKTLDLSKLNTEAAQIKFSNAAKAVDNATAAGSLVQVGGGKKQLSALGELYVQALPDRAAAKDAIAHAKPRRRSKSKATEPKVPKV
jgi:hypothetical protein